MTPRFSSNGHESTRNRSGWRSVAGPQHPLASLIISPILFPSLFISSLEAATLSIERIDSETHNLNLSQDPAHYFYLPQSADLRDPTQRAVVKSWLLDPNRTPTELRSFARVIPNNNHFVSNNPLTIEPHESGAKLAARDREMLQIIRSWRQDPAFQTIAPQLATDRRPPRPAYPGASLAAAMNPS